jgi:hypothetical protein
VFYIVVLHFLSNIRAWNGFPGTELQQLTWNEELLRCSLPTRKVTDMRDTSMGARSNVADGEICLKTKNHAESWSTNDVHYSDTQRVYIHARPTVKIKHNIVTWRLKDRQLSKQVSMEMNMHTTEEPVSMQQQGRHTSITIKELLGNGFFYRICREAI